MFLEISLILLCIKVIMILYTNKFNAYYNDEVGKMYLFERELQL